MDRAEGMDGWNEGGREGSGRGGSMRYQRT